MLASAVKLREYEKIFTGSTQDGGYENPIFSFTSDTVLQTFPVDQITYFHYPYRAPTILLSDTTLINDGAIGGTSPHSSDKIWKKMANYKNSSVWGEANPLSSQTGVWLCSWLSANIDNVSATPVWKDRWYNPGYIDETSAMFVSTTPASNILIDVDTQMLFEGGCYYKYQHLGNTFIDEHLGALSATNLKLYIEEWSKNPEDLSVSNNLCEVINFDNNITYSGVNPVERPEDNSLILNGNNQYCKVLYNSSIALTGDLTYSLWAYADDWNNIQGSTIVGKNHRGGWGLKYSNGFYNPLLVAGDSSGKLAFLNTVNNIFNTKTLPEESIPTKTQTDSNLFTWVLDNGIYNNYKHLYKVDINGDLVNSVALLSTTNLIDLQLDQNENVWILDRTSNVVSGFNNYTLEQVFLSSAIFYSSFDNTTVNIANLNTIKSVLSANQITFGSDRYDINDHAISFTSELSSYYRPALSSTFYGTINGGSIIYTNVPCNITSAFTIGYWLNTPDPYYPMYNVEVGIGDPVLYTNQAGIGLFMRSSSGGPYEFYSTTEGQIITANEWAYITSTFDLELSTVKIYFNGSLKTTKTRTVPMSSVDSNNLYNITIGGRFPVFTNGKIDDVLILDYAISDEEVLNIYDNSKYNYNFNLVNNTVQNSSITFDFYGNLVGMSSKYSDYNSDNQLVSSNMPFVIDKEDNVWEVETPNIFTKTSKDGSLILSGTVGHNVSTIDLTNEFTNGSYKDYVYFINPNDNKIFKLDENGLYVKDYDTLKFDINPNMGNFSSYNWNRKFNYVRNKNVLPQIQSEIYLTDLTTNVLNKYTLYIETSGLSNKDWHMFTFSFDTSALNFYVDSILRDSLTDNVKKSIHYEYENSLIIGADVGKFKSLGEEIQTNSLYFKGKIDSLKIYDILLNNYSIRNLYLSKYDYKDLYWNMPTGNRTYLEEVERFFKFKMPGIKSQYYNIKIKGLDITEQETRNIIEKLIKDTIKKVSPVYTELYKIVWE